MSCCGATPDHEDLAAVSRLGAGRLSAFLKGWGDNGFAVGLAEGQDAAAMMTEGYADKPGLLRSAVKHLFSARKSEWDRFDGLFDAFWLGKRARSRSLVSGAVPAANSPSLKSLQDANASQRGPQGATDQIPSDDGARNAGGEGRSEGASRVETLADTDFRKLADPDQMALAHEAAARLAKA